MPVSTAHPNPAKGTGAACAFSPSCSYCFAWPDESLNSSTIIYYKMSCHEKITKIHECKGSLWFTPVAFSHCFSVGGQRETHSQRCDAGYLDKTKAKPIWLILHICNPYWATNLNPSCQDGRGVPSALMPWEVHLRSCFEWGSIENTERWKHGVAWNISGNHGRAWLSRVYDDCPTSQDMQDGHSSCIPRHNVNREKCIKYHKRS